MINVSIILCTRNRADDLRQTLDAIERVPWPADVSGEWLIVDNDSTDSTASLVQGWRSVHGPVQYLVEKRGHKSAGLNQAIRIATGEILIFVDDDVRPVGDWMGELIRPIRAGEADAAQGSIRMAAHLKRSWMTPEHYLMFACNDGIGTDDPNVALVGANMAIRRSVFETIPAFDEAIGPGICPGSEDTLLSNQIKLAGFRIVRANAAVVEHHFNPARLNRSAILANARASAFGDFYLRYHWSHEAPLHPRWLTFRTWLKLQYLRVRRIGEWTSHPAAPAWEKSLIQELTMYRHFGAAHPPQFYERFGLSKRVT